MELKHQIFNGRGRSEIAETMEHCLYSLLDDYDHSRMTVFTRLVEMLLETDLHPESSKILKVVDLIKFPVKKSIE